MKYPLLNLIADVDIDRSLTPYTVTPEVVITAVLGLYDLPPPRRLRFTRRLSVCLSVQGCGVRVFL